MLIDHCGSSLQAALAECRDVQAALGLANVLRAPGETSESREGSASSSSGGTDTRLIIGLCVALGVPALIDIVGTIM